MDRQEVDQHNEEEPAEDGYGDGPDSKHGVCDESIEEAEYEGDDSNNQRRRQRDQQ